jgi:hypothetical protein
MSCEYLDTVQAATGVAPDVTSTMLLSVYDGTVLDLSSLGRGPAGGQVWKRAWGLFRGSRCCPDCVAAADGVWRLWWRLGGAAACPEHQVLLHGQCPWCGLPLRWGNYQLPIRTPYPANGLMGCMNWPRGSRGMCGFPLAELPVRPAPAEVLEVQGTYLRAAAGQALHLAGKEVTAAGWFAEISQMVALALPPFTRRAFMTSRLPGRPKVRLGKFLHPEPHLARQGLTSAHVPGYVNRDDVLEQVTPHLAPKRGAGPGGWLQRRFAALCLVLMVSDVPTWDEAADELGLPPLTANRTAVALLRIGDLLAFREGLIVLGSRLVKRGLVDYRARRIALADLTEMPAGDWASRPTAKKTPERYDRGRIFAAAWIWSDFTSGRYDESPAWTAYSESGAPATPMGSSRFYANWLLKQGPIRRDWLRSWGSRYLEDRNRESHSR